MSTLDDVPEELALAVGEAEKLGRRLVRPGLRAHERARDLPDDVLREAFALGAPLAALPEAAGGLGLGFAGAVRLEEALATADPAFPFALGSATTLGLALLELGGVEAARAPLARLVASEGRATAAVAFCDAEDAETTAEPEGEDVRLRGTKRLVVEGDRASDVLVFARRGSRRAAYLLDGDTAGLARGPRVATLGLDLLHVADVTLDARVPAAAEVGAGRDLDRAVVRFFARHAVLVAARAVGLARFAFEEARAYVGSRRAFGKPIGHFQAVAFTVADRAIDVEAARALVLRAAAGWDALDAARAPGEDPSDLALERRCLLATAHAVAYAQRAAARGADDAVQLHGGAGFMRDYPVEKLLRDAKTLELCTLSPEHAAQLAAACELEIPPDPALVLPSPSSQGVLL